LLWNEVWSYILALHLRHPELLWDNICDCEGAFQITLDMWLPLLLRDEFCS
jgi:hypothetical protein